MKTELDNSSYENAAVTDLVYIWNKDLTLSIVSKMDFAAARPEAKASKQGDAWPRFIAAMSTPKNTWKKSQQQHDKTKANLCVSKISEK